MKEMGTYLANRLGKIHWYPSESRAQDGWGLGEPQRVFLGGAGGGALEAAEIRSNGVGSSQQVPSRQLATTCLIGYTNFINKLLILQ